MPKSTLNTSDPIALRYLMNETIFGIGKADTLATDGGVLSDKMAQKQLLHFRFYGKNKRNYLFVTEEQAHEWMSIAALEAFTKTLAALKLTMEDVAVLNLATLKTSPQKEDIISFFSPKAMVFLGAPLQSLGLEGLSSKMVAEYNGIAVFHTCTFDEMLADGEKKRLFWTTIKTLLI